MSSTLSTVVDAGHAVAATAAGGGVVYGGAAIAKLALAAMVRPEDVEPWLVLIGHVILTAFNGGILLYHLVNKARRDEVRAWRELNDTPGPRPPALA
jgi:hypothetical protein